MSSEKNPFDQPLSSLSNISQIKKSQKEEAGIDIGDKKTAAFQENMAWQKKLESEDPEFMKDVKINLLEKIPMVIDHLENIINDPESSPYEKAEAQEELEKRKAQYNRLNYKYKNND